MAAESNHSSSLRLVPILTWLLIQLAALSLAAFAIPLWTHHPAPRESLAPQEMIATQIAASAMLFPILLPNLSTALVIIVLTWPFLHLASMMSITTEPILLSACLYVSLWIIGLWSIARSLRSTSAMLLAICLAGLFTLGGTILWYLHLEASSTFATGEMFGPLIGAVLQMSSPKPLWVAWVEAGLPLLIGGVFGAWKKRISDF